jgi:translocation and assembly module TamB
MPQQEQVSWLILGRPLESAGSSGDRSLLAGAALSLGVGGSNLLAQNLKQGLGLDEISIGADPGEDPGSARFTVGKYLSPKLYVSYGVGIFLPGSRVKMTYDLGRGFKLSSESGVDTGADLLYSWERE